MELPHPAILAQISPLSVTALVMLLVISSFFSMSETVFASLNPIRLRHAIDAGKKGAKKALWINERFDTALSTILVGNNLANIALASISLGVFSRLFSQSETVITIMNTLIMTTVVLIFGEIIPKSFGKRYADEIALYISHTLYFTIHIFKPLTILFIGIKKLILKDSATPMITVTEDELETIIDTMEEEGTIDEDDAEMLQSVLDLREKRVYEIMTPRVDMAAIDINEDIESIKNHFFEHQFSRMPVYEHDRDTIVGILNERNFFTCLIKGETVDVKTLMSEPIFVSKSMRVDNLIETLQKQNAHLAIVSDEFGGTAGIVTMEDALEELVGEIYDEHDDVDAALITAVGEHRFHVLADIDMDDLFEELSLGEPPVTDQSLAAYLFDQVEDLPEENTEITLITTIPSYQHNEADTQRHVTFRILAIEDRRIRQVEVIVQNVEEMSS